MSPLRSLIGNSGRPAQQGRKAEPAKLDSELQPLCFHSQAITTSILGWLLVHVCIPLLWHYPYAPSQRAQFVSSSYAPPFNSSATTPLMRLVGQIGRAHVWTPVTSAHLVCRLLLEKKKNNLFSTALYATHKPTPPTWVPHTFLTYCLHFYFSM